MASTLPMNQTAIQGLINLYVANNPVAPDTTDTEWTINNSLSNQAITTWENEREVNWKELWVGNYSLGTVASATTSFPLPDDFKVEGGFVRFINSSGNVKRIPFVGANTINNINLAERNPEVVYRTGTPGNYVLNLGSSPATATWAIGNTVKLDYYRFADKLSAAVDAPDMSDPMFIVWFVTAQRKLSVGEDSQYTVYNNMALESLRMMKVSNVIGVEYHDNTLENTDYLVNGNILGGYTYGGW